MFFEYNSNLFFLSNICSWQKAASRGVPHVEHTVSLVLENNLIRQYITSSRTRTLQTLFNRCFNLHVFVTIKSVVHVIHWVHFIFCSLLCSLSTQSAFVLYDLQLGLICRETMSYRNQVGHRASNFNQKHCWLNISDFELCWFKQRSKSNSHRKHICLNYHTEQWLVRPALSWLSSPASADTILEEGSRSSRAAKSNNTVGGMDTDVVVIKIINEIVFALGRWSH